jgi:hypothetical protein
MMLDGSLYTVFEPDEARRILRKLEFHFTPKHASWLNARARIKWMFTVDGPE